MENTTEYWGFVPLAIFSIIGLFVILFPKAALWLQHQSAAFKRQTEYTDGAILTTRVAGFVFIIIGVYLMMLISYDIDLLDYIRRIFQ